VRGKQTGAKSASRSSGQQGVARTGDGLPEGAAHDTLAVRRHRRRCRGKLLPCGRRPSWASRCMWPTGGAHARAAEARQRGKTPRNPGRTTVGDNPGHQHAGSGGKRHVGPRGPQCRYDSGQPRGFRRTQVARPTGGPTAHTRPGIVAVRQWQVSARMYLSCTRCGSRLSTAPRDVHGSFLACVRTMIEAGRGLIQTDVHLVRGRAESVLIPQGAQAADLRKLPRPRRSSRSSRARRRSSG
jgi:hypothetical protein